MATIQWTPEQIAERERQKAAHPPQRRIRVELTPEQQAAWRKAAEEEDAHKEATIAHVHKLTVAASEPGFFGDLRRAINASGHRVFALPDEIGVESQLFDDFRAGDAELPAAAIARLVDALGLRLMHEIPPDAPESPHEVSATDN